MLGQAPRGVDRDVQHEGRAGQVPRGPGVAPGHLRQRLPLRGVPAAPAGYGAKVVAHVHQQLPFGGLQAGPVDPQGDLPRVAVQAGQAEQARQLSLAAGQGQGAPMPPLPGAHLGGLPPGAAHCPSVRCQPGGGAPFRRGMPRRPQLGSSCLEPKGAEDLFAWTQGRKPGEVGGGFLSGRGLERRKRRGPDGLGDMGGPHALRRKTRPPSFHLRLSGPAVSGSVIHPGPSCRRIRAAHARR